MSILLFLFNERLSTSLPTLPLKGLKRSKNDLVPVNWQEELSLLLEKTMTYHIIRAQLYYSSHTTIRSLRSYKVAFIKY